MKKQLSKTELKDLNTKLEELYGLTGFFGKKERVELIDNEYILQNGKPVFFYHAGLPAPTLKLLLKNNFLKKVVVDMGAIRFVTSGADIMKPGITTFDGGLKVKEFVVIVDEKHAKPLAVGEMLLSGEEMATQTGGKVVKNLHYVGDKLWKEY